MFAGHEFKTPLQKNALISTFSIVDSVRKELAACLHLSENYFLTEFVNFENFFLDKGVLIDDQGRVITVQAILTIDQEIEDQENVQRIGMRLSAEKLNTIIAGLIFLKEAFLNEWFRFSQNAILPKWIEEAQTRFEETLYFAQNIEEEANKFCSNLNNRYAIKLKVLFEKQ